MRSYAEKEIVIMSTGSKETFSLISAWPSNNGNIIHKYIKSIKLGNYYVPVVVITVLIVT